MFYDRRQAGSLLVERLKKAPLLKAVIYAIARGGVVVGYEIARKLRLPFHVLIVKKIGAPYNSELAMGSIAPEKISYIDGKLALGLGIDQKQLDALMAVKEKELSERVEKYKIKYPKSLSGKSIILTDDGVATGATVIAAIKYLRRKKAQKVILAVPVVAKDTFVRLQPMVDKLIALEVAESFGAVGQFYEHFPQVSDEEVIKIIQSTNHPIT